MPSDFPGAFRALRRILARHARGMVVRSDTPTDYTLHSKTLGPNGKPMWFGAVLSGKSAVSYHLMPLYFNPRLKAAIAPELLPRMQGKTCFNFQRPDAALFARLAELTKLGHEAWRRAGFLAPGRITPERMESTLRDAGEDPRAIAAHRKSTVERANAKRAATVRVRRASVSRAAKPAGATKRPAARRRRTAS